MILQNLKNVEVKQCEAFLSKHTYVTVAHHNKLLAIRLQYVFATLDMLYVE